MFTGLIADVGRIAGITRQARGARVTVETAMDLGEVAIGDSIAVNGACLTAVGLGKGRFEADLSAETLGRTTLRTARAGEQANLELALRVGDRLGGHLVQGHVDGVGHKVDERQVGDAWELSYEIPDELLGAVVEKGSIAIDGVSLTIAKLAGPRVTVAVVPHTLERTNLRRRQRGAPVNVETDVIGKYVERSVRRLRGMPSPDDELLAGLLERFARGG